MVERCKRIANAFVLMRSFTPEMDLARVLTVRVWRGAFTFKPDSLAAISLSGDELAARTDHTRDTDGVSLENVLTDDPDLSWKHKWAPEEQTHTNSVACTGNNREYIIP